MPSNPRAAGRPVIVWAVAGMAGVFVAIGLLVRVSGEPWSTAAGVAGLPTIFGGWYLGALLPLSRHDFSDDPSAAGAVVASPSATLPSGDERVEEPDGHRDVVTPAA